MVVTEQAQDDAPWSVSWPNLRIPLFRDWKIYILPVSMFGNVCWLPTVGSLPHFYGVPVVFATLYSSATVC